MKPVCNLNIFATATIKFNQNLYFNKNPNVK